MQGTTDMYQTNVDHKMVQVNAAFKSQGTNTNFSIDFQTRDLDKVTKVTMIKATLPRLFPNIWSANYQIDIQHPAGIDNFFNVPAGQYNVTTLTTALNTATAGINVSWAYNTTTNRFTATYSGVGTATLSAANSTIGPYIGLTADVTLGAPSDLPSPPQLSGPDEVFILSQLVGATSCVAAGSQNSIPFVGSISFTDVPYGFTGKFECNGLDIAHVEFPFEVCMRRIDVQLVDPLGNEISLPDNAYLNMILQFSY